MRPLSSASQVNRKLFVRGISWSTTNESLAAAFNEFGDVEEATVVMDKSTGKSKVRIGVLIGSPSLVHKGSQIEPVCSSPSLSIPTHSSCVVDSFVHLCGQGFGFVRFASGESAFAALARGSLSLDVRKPSPNHVFTLLLSTHVHIFKPPGM